MALITEMEAQARAAGLVGTDTFKGSVKNAVTALLNANGDDEEAVVALGSSVLVVYAYQLSGLSAEDFMAGVQATVDDVDVFELPS